jgi:thioredoxin reductase
VGVHQLPGGTTLILHFVQQGISFARVRPALRDGPPIPKFPGQRWNITIMEELLFDVVIVGGGPAGLSAALLLGRSRRRIMLCDSGRPRNIRSHAMHGYLSRDGIVPADFLRMGRAELAPYGVRMCHGEVVQARCLEGGEFETTMADGTLYRSRKLLLATGVVDKVPQIEGFDALYGTSVFHCPYCDGWEVRDRALAVYGRKRGGVELSRALKVWSQDVFLCTDGGRVSPSDRQRLELEGIGIREEPVERLLCNISGGLEAIVFKKGEPLQREALFFTTGQRGHSDLAGLLGCAVNPNGTVSTGRKQETTVPGLYVVGDISRDMQLVIVAAAEGAKAGIAINMALMKEDQAAIDQGRTSG